MAAQTQSLSVLLSPHSCARHSFFIKPHVISSSSSSSSSVVAEGRTLFVGNIDANAEFDGQNSNDVVREYLQRVFGCFGDIDTIAVSEFNNNNSNNGNRNTRFAHVTFTKRSSLKAALDNKTNNQIVSNIVLDSSSNPSKPLFPKKLVLPPSLRYSFGLSLFSFVPQP